MSDQDVAVPAQEPTFILREGVSSNLKTMASWMKFMAVVMFVFGGLYALSLVGLIVAWFPILVGYWLYRGANKVNIFVNNDQEALDDAVKMLKYYFMANGIAMIISVVLGILYVIIMIGVFVAAAATGGSMPFEDLF